MKSEGLRKLHMGMKVNEEKRYKFKFRYSNKEFEVIFFTDTKPYELLFGAIGTRVSFTAIVKAGYDIEIRLSKENYNKLREILNIPIGTENPFKTTDFFRAFCDSIPEYNLRNAKVNPQDIGKYRSDLEESEKIYFYGWLDNTISGGKVKNLEKTRVLLGEETYLFCKRRNISSKWTNDPKKEKKIILPK
ncbi:DUF6037 family protein [Clostridium tertium]|jgi:hypothetical protein